MYVHFLHMSSTSILLSNPFFMSVALFWLSISSMVLSLTFPRFMVPLLSRQQGTSVPLTSIPMYLLSPWQYPFSVLISSFGFGQLKDSS